MGVTILGILKYILDLRIQRSKKIGLITDSILNIAKCGSCVTFFNKSIV